VEPRPPLHGHEAVERERLVAHRLGERAVERRQRRSEVLRLRRARRGRASPRLDRLSGTGGSRGHHGVAIGLLPPDALDGIAHPDGGIGQRHAAEIRHQVL
ncbi:MAG: hypothetical protein ACK55I_21665, partial [bacterium]